MDAAELVDPTRLRELRAEYGDVADQLLALFERTAAETLGELRAALAAGDREELRRLAHRLKGSARNVGATGMAELSAALEAGPPDVPQALARLDAAFAPTRDALRAALAA
jgi:two-component system, sensor histidine kinase and response regulator